MSLNQIGGEHFSAIAASSNSALKRDSEKVRRLINFTLLCDTRIMASTNG